MDLSIDQIVAGTGAKVEVVELHFESVIAACEENTINTELRVAHFLAECAHESALFSRTEENLNYSADSLHRVFNRYFPTMDLASQYHRQPRKIASRVYANRMGNGPEETEDGWFHRGAGCIQLTGANNQRAYWEAHGDGAPFERDAIVGILKAVPHAMRTAGWFWTVNNINTHADRDDVRAVAGVINVGNANATEKQIIGYTDRVALTQRMKGALGI
jgi:putative chitinase